VQFLPHRNTTSHQSIGIDYRKDPRLTRMQGLG
jgi:hypothetical protein